MKIATMAVGLGEKEFKSICQSVASAAKLCEAVRSEKVMSMAKADQSPVTIADYGSQAIICKTLQEIFPEDPVVAEEDASDLRTNTEQLKQVAQYVAQTGCSCKEEDILGWIDNGNGKTNMKRFWTLDPIDGTKGYIRGDQYAICLALIEGGHTQAGILACPALDVDGTIGHLFTAQRGKGAFRKQLGVNESASWKKLQVDKSANSAVQSFEASHGNHSAQETVAKAIGIGDMIPMDSQAKYSMVASGKAALYLRLSNYHENIWDHAAGTIIVQEAGGKVTDRNGKPLNFASAKMFENSGVVVSNGSTHDAALSILQNY
mmetsp:Transcript_13991/g.21342  ORF Transcript_13991/g.21342 Transcript_13991/m.21342 type:complete len:319 (+) Transcript_13991:68-1024(+)